MSDEFFLTFVSNGVEVDLVVPVASGTGADLIAAASARYGESASQHLCIERTGVEVVPNQTIAQIGLLNGDHVLVGHRGGKPAALTKLHRLTVVEGPETGRIVELSIGTIELGRGADGNSRIGLDDSTVSRKHAALEVTTSGIKLEDLASTNGTELNDKTINSSCRLETGDLIRLGDSVLRVDISNAAVSERHLTRISGQISFNREPRVVTADPAAVFELESPPTTPQKRRFPLPAAVVPVVMGVVMFKMLGSPMFLMFAAMGPLMIIWTYTDDRRSGRKEFTEEKTRFESQLASLEQKLKSLQETRKSWLYERHPDAGSLAQRAHAHDRKLWRRRTQDEDFISIRVGTGTLPSPTSVRLPQSGDEDLLESAANATKKFAVEHDVPVVISLFDRPILGVVERSDGVSNLLRGLVTQLVTDQSPRDVALAILAPSHSQGWEFAKWLPHVQSLGPDIRLVAKDDDQAKALFGALNGLVEQRMDAAEEAIGGGRNQFSPRIVVVIHPPAKLARREVSKFLERAVHVGVSVIWVETDRASLPGECTTVIDQDIAGTSVTFTDTGLVKKVQHPEGVSTETMDAVARRLASLVDVASGADSTIPTRIDLLELLEMPNIRADDVCRSWELPRKGLGALIGADADGAVEVDWRVDGPHALVAGMTGAGKSELLQSLVASMAVLHPPTRVTFVLVDYKGGSAFMDCEGLPHTVGMLTDLDDHLAERVLVSLRAELRWREHLLADHEAKDIIEMTEKAPKQAPPNMIIIIDEFAALKSEVPDFVDGVIDIAQRGRSLGVHLLLATQQPSGVIDPKIQGNTNLRIALRVADQADSIDVIGKPDANEISRSTPGRGYVRTGPTDVSEFQSAYVGGSGQGDEDVSAVTFYFGIEERAQMAKMMADPTSTVSDLQRLVTAVRQAAVDTHLAETRKPWLEPIGDEVLYTSIAEHEPNSRLGAVVGLGDHPAQQMQQPFVIDFEEHSNFVVYGSSGSGKTTLMRTLAMDLALRRSADELWLYAFDFASRGLASLEKLPHCGGVVYSDDLSRTRRLLEILTRATDERRQELARVNAANPSEYESITGSSMARIVVLIDGFGQLWEALDRIDRSEHLVRLASLFAEGRSVGMHFVISADRRQAVPSNVGATISGRIMMRMSEPDEYSSFGLPKLARSKPPINGRAFTPDGIEIQIAVLNSGALTTAAAQSSAIAQLSTHLQAPSTPIPRADLLPERVDYFQIGATNGLQVPVGIDETHLGPVAVDFADASTFIVFGPDRSGRSTALMTMTRGLEPAIAGAYLLAGRRSPLQKLPVWDQQATGRDNAIPVAELLREKFEDRSQTGDPGAPILVVLDDADEFDEGAVSSALDLIVRRARDANFIVLASMTTFMGMKCYSSWARAMRSNRSGLLLQPDLEDDGDLFGLRLPQRSGLDMPEGRGYLISRSSITWTQIASGDET